MTASTSHMHHSLPLEVFSLPFYIIKMVEMAFAASGYERCMWSLGSVTECSQWVDLLDSNSDSPSVKSKSTLLAEG